MKSKGIAVPYVIWMAIFVVAPLLIIVFYAFTSQAGGFTLENFSTMAQYTGVFGAPFYWPSSPPSSVCSSAIPCPTGWPRRVLRCAGWP